MQIECPECSKEINVTDELPASACDENEIECECGAMLEIGWYATAEVRGVKSESSLPAPLTKVENT